MIRNFSQAKQFLEEFIPKAGISHTTMQLDRIRALCRLIGNPQNKYPVIHVGGTSGKGSTATFASTILANCEVKVGLHLSPHLESITERMQINNKPISETDFVQILNKVVGSIKKVIDAKLGVPSYFEILLAMSFLYFQEQKVDTVVLEVGLGGKLDGTNIVLPSAVIFTNVSLDHTAILGRTVVKICYDKMGIIKPFAPFVVSGITQQNLRLLLIRECKDFKVPLFLIHRDFKLRPENLSLQGDFQHLNFTLAVEAVNRFVKHFFPQKMDRIGSAIKIAARDAFIPGRFEIVNKQPLTILDGAHNKAKMQALVASVSLLYPEQKFISVVAVKEDKKIKSILKELDKVTSHYIFTRFTQTIDLGKNLATGPQLLSKHTMIVSVIEPDPIQAISQAKKMSVENNLPLLITGSLYLVGEVRKLWRTH